jgi:hypothetical protein
MKRNHRLNLLSALALGALGSCSYYETPTTSMPEYTTGHVVTTLPSGYRTVTVGGTRYYSYGDSYYRPHGSGYIIVDSPYGTTTRMDTTVVRELPSGYRVVTRGGQRYYQAGNVYYQSRPGGYVVVESPF